MSEKQSPPVAIILINWNNAPDTLECLESILKSDYDNYAVFILDNNSDDNSVETINDWIKKEYSADTERENIPYSLWNNADNFSYSGEKIILIAGEQNLGFAAGNNFVLKLIIDKNPDFSYFYLLNNDTVILPDTVSSLIKAMQFRKIRVANSLIIDYFNRDIIQFAGGKLLPWGKAEFYYQKPNDFAIKSEFAHGCALMVESRVFKDIGLLTEKFFHGEEDFEFSWRLKKEKIEIWCFFNSIVYHKEGQSVNNYMRNSDRKLTLSVLNRIVDMKSHYPLWLWRLWKFFVLLHYYGLFKKNGNLTGKVYFKILSIVNKQTNHLNTVGKDTVSLIWDSLEK